MYRKNLMIYLNAWIMPVDRDEVKLVRKDIEPGNAGELDGYTYNAARQKII